MCKRFGMQIAAKRTNCIDGKGGWEGCHVFIKGTYIHVWLDESLYFEPEKRCFCSSLSANETVKVKKNKIKIKI